MHIDAPDPHPGRCRNYRTVGGTTLRCLDYENVPHRCSFPELPKPVHSDLASSMYRQSEPKPWIKPVSAERTNE
jgi:hypothetical protein